MPALQYVGQGLVLPARRLADKSKSTKTEMKTHKNEKSLEYIKELTNTSLITRLNGLPENSDHIREKSLEGLL